MKNNEMIRSSDNKIYALLEKDSCVVYKHGILDKTHIPANAVLITEEQYEKLCSGDLIVEDFAIMYKNNSPKRKALMEKEQTLEQINIFKQKLAAMDYKGQKYLDGEYTQEQWSAIMAERKTIRQQIRTLEAQIVQEY